MSLWHCRKCHHEWERTKKIPCDWCGEDSYILKSETEFEKSIIRAIKELKQGGPYLSHEEVFGRKESN